MFSSTHLLTQSGLGPVEEAIGLNECLVFVKSVAGVEAARRNGKRVIWVPNVDVGVVDEGETHETDSTRPGMIDPDGYWQRGEFGDGWGEYMSSLIISSTTKYGIIAPS